MEEVVIRSSRSEGGARPLRIYTERVEETGTKEGFLSGVCAPIKMKKKGGV